MQKANLKIRRESKKMFYQRNALYPLFRGNGGTRGTKPCFTRKICISVCTPFLKMYPLLYFRVAKKTAVLRNCTLCTPLYTAERGYSDE